MTRAHPPADARRRLRAMATWKRAAKLFTDFQVEQSDPDRFYGTMASDSVAQMQCLANLEGAHVLDVGGGPGYWADAFEAAGARYTPLDADAGELALHGRVPLPGTVMGDGQALPFRTGSFDLVYSSNVGEHVRHPWTMGDEMVRVCRPGGLVFYSYTLWYGPWGGHETAPWHYVNGRYAAQRYRREKGHEPKNLYGTSLFPVSMAQGIRWARSQPNADVVDIIPRYLPSSLFWTSSLPVVREILTWNVALILRRR
ncbi:MAG: class I SAM-dependent methyltransferase [Candidatus Nanopelagicales bacterium]